MTDIFGIPLQAFLGQLLLGPGQRLVLRHAEPRAWRSSSACSGIVNFAHGALYMIGAYVAWMLLDKFGINYWFALLLAPLVVGVLGVVIERTLLKQLYKLDPLYGLLLTFGLALIAEGVFRDQFGVSGQSYPVPELLQGATNLGFMVLPNYRAWVVVASLRRLPGHLVRDRAHPARRLPARRHREPDAGAGVRHQRAADGHAHLCGAAPALAALAGVLAAPVIQVNAADGLQPDHRGVRGRRHRRHGLDPRLDPHRPRRSA